MNNLIPSNQQGMDATIQGATDILEILIEEAKRRLDDPKQIRKMTMGDVLERIEKMLLALKKTNIIIPKQVNFNMGEMQKRVIELDAHPTRRKEYREAVRKLNSHPA